MILPRGWRTVLELAWRRDPWRALGATLTVARGKRVRGWNRLFAIAADHRQYYRRWVAEAEPRIGREVLDGTPAPTGGAPVLVLVLGNGDGAAAHRTLASVRAAFGPVAVGSDVAGLTGVTTVAAGSDLRRLLETIDPALAWLCPIAAGDTVSAEAGRVIAASAVTDRLIYWDEDVGEGERRHAPLLRPDRIPAGDEGLVGAGLIAVAAAKAVAADGTIRFDAAGLTRLMTPAAADGPARHVPLILTHRADPPPPRSGVRADALGSPRSADWPSVSILIPTRDRADLLAVCLAGLERLDYPGAVEIVVIDNDSVEPRTHALFDGLRASGRGSVLAFAGPFDFAAMTNRGAAVATGTLLCLLNNDIEPLDGTWLTVMADFARRERAGAVGARLLYPDGRLQHAGVAIGIGGAAGHVQKGVDPADPRFADWHARTRIVSAVTAACLVVDRACYLAVGGMDAAAFAVDFNDVDLCLRLGQAGLHTVVVAEATLIHHESVSRGTARFPAAAVQAARELAALRARWGTDRCLDPHHSPRFRRASERCVLAF